MLTRRNVLRLAVGVVGSCLVRAESILGGNLPDTAHAQEHREQAQGMTVEAWMNEWMSVHKAVGGMLSMSKFQEPMYFLAAPISWTPNPDQKPYEPVTVPKGFVTDLASIPEIFFSLLRPDEAYAYAAVIHDYLYWTQTRSRGEADAIFNMAMDDFEVGKAKVTAIYAAVRMFGEAAWKANREKKAQGERRILKKFPQDPRTKWEDWKQRPDVFEEE